MPNMSDNTAFDAGMIRVRGARVHNLRGVDVDIPRQRLTVITGVSGSGKSSLAFDTIHAESQRRYLESLSSHTRTRISSWRHPSVDAIDGLPPTISVGQSFTSVSLRSTLATTTEILDYLRLLFARCGTAHCPKCGNDLSARSAQEIVDQILSWDDGRKVMILAPMVRSRRGQHREVFEAIAKSGFVRARVDGEIIEVSQPPALTKTKPHTIEAVVDRIAVKSGLRSRLQESVELALRHGDGTCVLCSQVPAGWLDEIYSNRFACADCGVGFSELEPRTLSFNSPQGACLGCRGLGVVLDDHVDSGTQSSSQSKEDNRCPECHGARLNPFSRAVTFQNLTLPGFLEQTVRRAFDVVQIWQRDGLQSQSPQTTLLLSSEATTKVMARTLPEIQRRLKFLIRVGADYLTLDRSSRTLSGGEFQRSRLAACLGSGLIGTCYVLDEPTIGLHPKDTAAMIQTLHELRNQGNTVLVVEHDTDVMYQADHLIDLGPGAGADGGHVIASGTPAEVVAAETSVIGRFLLQQFPSIESDQSGSGAKLPNNSESELSGRGTWTRDTSTTDGQNSDWLQLPASCVHNLKEVAARIPWRALTVVSGVSGSGKTSLVHHALVPHVQSLLQQSLEVHESARHQEPPSGCEVRRLVEVTQTPLGRSPASNLATYSKLWDDVCRLLAQTRDARLQGFRASRFRFNSPAGRCESCRGRGVQRLRLKLLLDVFVTCPTCRGDRFNSATLQVRFRGMTAADILKMRVDEALNVFANVTRISSVLRTFSEVGLDYLQLGQSATTLSGGEAQRVKLATELARESVEPTLFVLDEPTTGLHPQDVERLIALLKRLVTSGHTVVVIEHNLAVIAQADWLIDLGPEGGDRGGIIVADGSPTDVARRGSGHTADALRNLNQRAWPKLTDEG